MSAGGMSASAWYQDIKTKGAPVAVDEEYLKKVLDEIRPNLQADGGDL